VYVNKQNKYALEQPIVMERQTAAIYQQRTELQCAMPIGNFCRVVWTMKAKKVSDSNWNPTGRNG
jgi:hypothetical protein